FGGSAATTLGSAGAGAASGAVSTALATLSSALDFQSSALARLIASIDPNAGTGAGANIDILA
ncbi:MAG: hypothetical protein JNK11_06755, partial [Alphaproteobacteria bacterium]|nr:hypothetical protein [Alphaproteobacteria bacterium]